MTNRTFKFYGKGYAPDPVSITATANGNVVFSGTVPTVNEPLPYPDESTAGFEVLFSMDMPLAVTGLIPMSVQVTAGGEAPDSGICFGGTQVNYGYIPNPVYSSAQYQVMQTAPRSAEALNIITTLANPAFSTEEIATLSDPATTDAVFDQMLGQHGIAVNIMGGASNFSHSFTPEGDSRTNVTLDGTPMTTPNPRPAGKTGNWIWKVPTGSTLAFDLIVENPGVE